MVQGVIFFPNSILIDIDNHSMLSNHFRVFIQNLNDGKNENPIYAIFAGKIWPLVPKTPLSFVPGTVRCSSKLCLLQISLAWQGFEISDQNDRHNDNEKQF